ncbi:MAG: class II fumarate hydratase [Phycisphaerae bacterium]|nr:class II fumarate hydratase [Phycisphaerae bacterium]
METKENSHSGAAGGASIPADALYGPQTALALENFPISGWHMPPRFISAMGYIKQAAATVHKNAGRLDADLADAIIAAAGEVARGERNEEFPVDVFQTGSGTSTNMNANEVIANRASEILGKEPDAVHPNDHVNMAQSSNDVIPTAMHVAAAVALHDELIPALRKLRDALLAKAQQFDDVVKIGRTHLMDAVPVRLGQEFSGYAAQIETSLSVLQVAMSALCELPIGGTAVGTGLNCPDGFAANVCLFLGEELRLPFCETTNHFAAAGARDLAVQTSGALRQTALAMGKIASDIRLMGSGPRCGLGELLLPALQPGSSIMPGKVNPVLCESVIQVACQVVGCDAAIAAGATGGVGSILDLNVAMTMIAWNLLTEIELLTGAAVVYREKCIVGLEADEQHCRELIEKSLAMVTALAPKIGYDRAAEIAKRAYASGQTIREICRRENILSEKELDKLLDAKQQTGG